MEKLEWKCYNKEEACSWGFIDGEANGNYTKKKKLDFCLLESMMKFFFF